MKTAIYLRQSLDKTGEGLAVDRQRQDCEKEATHRSWEVVGTYVDNDVSASSRNPRPAYERMLEDVRAGRVDAVLVWDVDRLTRRPIEVEDWIRLHERYGVNLVTISEHIDLSTDNGQMYLRIKVAVARAEVERKGTRQKRANLQAAQTAGEWVAVARSDSNRT